MDKVYPLSLLAFVACSHSLSLDREPLRRKGERKKGEEEEKKGEKEKIDKCSSQVTGLDHIFRRHVKLKKQREIVHLAEVG